MQLKNSAINYIRIIYSDKITMILLSLSLLLFIINIKIEAIHLFEANSFYYIENLSIFYWIGLILLLFVFLIQITIKKEFSSRIFLDLISIFILVIYLFGTPCFVYDNTRFMDVYGVVNEINTLLSTHTLQLTGALDYLNRNPGTYLFIAALSLLSNVSTMSIAKYFPIYLMLVLSLAVYAPSVNISKKYALVAPFALLSLSWVQEYHLAPQAYTLILYGIFILVISHMANNDKNLSEMSIILVLIGLSTVISHPLTPIFIIIGLTGLVFCMYFKKWVQFNINSNMLNTLILILLIITLLWVGWTTFISLSILNWLTLAIKNFLGFNIESNQYVLYNYNPTFDYMISNYISIAIGLIELLLGLISVVYLWVNKNKISTVFSILYLSPFIFVALSMVSNGVFAPRLFLFIVFPYSILLVLSLLSYNNTKLHKIKRIFNSILITFILISIVLIPITLYGGDSSEYYSQSELAGLSFVSNNNIPTQHILEKSTYNLNQMKSQNGLNYLNSFNSNTLIKIYDSEGTQAYIEKIH